MLFRYLILIITDFYDFISPFFPLVLALIKKTYQTRKKMSDRISTKHLQVRNKNSSARCIFKCPFGF